MMNIKKGNYTLCVDINQLAKDMIDSLGETGSAIDGNRISSYFILAKGETGEVAVSLIEDKCGFDPSEYHYTVLLIDGVCGDDEYCTLHQTKDLSLQSLIDQLNEIWAALGNDGAEDEKGKTETQERVVKPGNGVDEFTEFEFLKSYIQGACFDDEVSVDNLYALWIAFCIHQSLTPDKDKYQELLEELWVVLSDSEDSEVSHWTDFADFEHDMSRNLR